MTTLDLEATLHHRTKFIQLELIYTEAPVDGDGQHKVKYSVYLGFYEAGAPPVVVYDSMGVVRRRNFEYPLVPLEDDTFLQKSLPKEAWRRVKEAVDSHRLDSPSGGNGRYAVFKVVQSLKDVDIFLKLEWREFVDDVLNFKAQPIDPRLKAVRSTFLLKGVNQKTNPHAIICLPPITGKSEWPGWDARDKVSKAGLIGYADTDGPHFGVLHGAEAPIALDQFESQGGWDIFAFMPSLMEEGHADVDQAGLSFRVKSVCPIAVLANPKSDNSTKSFGRLMEKMTRISALGRRLGIILYDTQAVRLTNKPSNSEMDEWRRKVDVFRAAEQMCWPRVLGIFDDPSVWAWLNGRNAGWAAAAEKVIEPLQGEFSEIHDFLSSFIEHGQMHTRGGALRAAIAYNLDRIYLEKVSTDELITEAEEVLGEILAFNRQSLRNITLNFKEEKEAEAKASFDSLPVYLKMIVLAVNEFKRERQADGPDRVVLESLKHPPAFGFEYLSQAVKKARDGNPFRYNEQLDKVFGFELRAEAGHFFVTLKDSKPLAFLSALSKLSTPAEAAGQGPLPPENSGQKGQGGQTGQEKMETATKSSPTTEAPKGLTPDQGALPPAEADDELQRLVNYKRRQDEESSS